MLTRHPFPRLRLGATALLLTLAGGLSVPFTPVAHAATTPVGAVELSPTPPDQTQAVAPNIVMTFDDSGSMQSSRVNDQPPWTTDTSGNLLSGLPDWGNGTNDTSTTDSGGGPWRCAGVIDPTATSGIGTHVMNGVFYNPKIIYNPPTYADGTDFRKADATLTKVWVDGIAVNRHLSPVTADTTAGYNGNADLDRPSAGALTNLMGTAQYTYPTVTTYYATFGSTCPSNADAGSCAVNPSDNSGANYAYYVQGFDGTTGTGTTTVYYGVNLQASGSSFSGATVVSGDSTSNTSSPTQNFVTWTVTATNTSGTPTVTNDNRWQCGSGAANGGGGGDLWTAASPMDNQSHALSDGTTVAYPNGGPYYYRLKHGVTIAVDASGNPTNTGSSVDGLHTLYTASNWEAVPVSNTTVTINGQSVNQWQNFANWYAYYRTRNQMARSAISRVFGTGTLAAKTTDGGFGSAIRMAWQNLDTGTYKLPSTAIISSLIDTSACTAAASAAASPSTIQQSGTIKTPPSCYRSAFFNWIFQVPASGGTPTRSAINHAGQFFQRGYNSSTKVGNTGATGDLTDPYWQPPKSGTGDGKELACRQNFHMLVTDGLWNGGTDGPSRSTLTLPTTVSTLPDGVAFPSTSAAGVTSIYAPVADGGNSGYASLSDVAFHYWATNLRPDLYVPANGMFVAPYVVDKNTGVVTTTTLSGSSVKAANVNDEIYFNPVNDPASWPHMSEYLVGLGVSGQLNFSTDTDCSASSTDSSDACLLRTGKTNSSGAVGWPTPNGSGQGIAANVDDTWHAALAGRGQFFSAGNPQQLIDQLSTVLSNISARAAQPTTSAVNASVLVTGALSFNTGYDSNDWSGVLQAVTLNSDGTTAGTLWDASALLDDATATPPANRQILTSTENTDGSFKAGIAFESTSTFDAAAQTALLLPAPTDTTNDTLANRIDYLRGVRTEETSNVMRKRTHLLGAIINSQAVYVSYPSSGYTSSWPTGSPEAASGAETYDHFVSTNANRAGTLYVGANDGMLHAFNAPVPTCTTTDPTTGACTAFNAGTNAGKEDWAYIPRAVYGNLGNLTSKSFSFQPTVDATPVVRDVFFGDTGVTTTDSKWHTILVGGLRLGGRGVYALDITDPSAVTEANAASKVLWEFTPDAPAVTGVGNPADLGYTFGQPNIGRLANGNWVVLVPTSYYPDCSQPDKPANCQTLAAASNAYSALFVLDAQTGKMLAELKTPTTISGVTSYGLGSPVLGDYNNDQIDDVAFAGDLAGNLWRFDLSDSSPSNWKVTLAYQGQVYPATNPDGTANPNAGKQGMQPITVMPRLFPDPATNRFMVVFGTGKYLGAGDNTSDSASTQSVYGIRDELDSSGNPVTITHAGLQSQTLSETTINNTTDPNNGATLRKLTSNAVSSSAGGWYFDLSTTDSSNKVDDAGERVVVTPGAVFNTNTAIISTVIPGAIDPCNPTVHGALMLIDATTGGPGSGVSSLGGIPYVGGRVNNVRTSGTIPVTTVVGGGKTLFPGMTLTGKKTNPDAPFAGDAPIWRRRSWSEINNVP